VTRAAPPGAALVVYGEENAVPPRRLILFGAFDRHNFGDLLLGRCAAAARPGRAPVFAGLAARDLRAFDGHRVRALAEVIADHEREAADFVHVGGELITTTAWEAAVMLQSPRAARAAIAAYDRQPVAREAWARRVLGCGRRLPYLVAAGALPPRWRVHFDAVGGSGLAGLAADQRAEALAALRQAESHSVTIGHAIAVGRRAHDRSAQTLRQSGTARRLYGKTRTA